MRARAFISCLCGALVVCGAADASARKVKFTEHISAAKEFVIEHCSVQYEQTLTLLRNNPDVGYDVLDPATYSDDVWVEDLAEEVEWPMSEAAKQIAAWRLWIAGRVLPLSWSWNLIENAATDEENGSPLKKLKTHASWVQAVVELGKCLYPTDAVRDQLPTKDRDELEEMLAQYECLRIEDYSVDVAEAILESTEVSELVEVHNSIQLEWESAVSSCGTKG